MDEYKASIDSVDSALARLNQTLKSLMSSKNAQQQTTTSHAVEEPIAPQHDEPVPGDKLLSWGFHSMNMSGVASTDRSMHWPIRQLLRTLRVDKSYPEPVEKTVRLERLACAQYHFSVDPYNFPLYLFAAAEYLGLGYPDLAAGAAYKAMLLSDALDDEADEYHEVAEDSLKVSIQQIVLGDRIKLIKSAMEVDENGPVDAARDSTLDIELDLWLESHYNIIMYRLLTRSLLLCGCLWSAYRYASRGFGRYKDAELQSILNDINDEASRQGPQDDKEKLRIWNGSPSMWPDNGYVRREHYPWNTHEPDRLNALDELNEMMGDVSNEKLEVRAVQLPALNGDPREVVTQLGVFAKKDIEPGECILEEISLLTANNKLQDALCDACSGDLPTLDSPEYHSVVACPMCEVVFCSEWCYEAACDSYHPSLCEKDVESIAKDVEPAEAADSLYSLLLLRALAMANYGEEHPLDLPDVKFIWGDLSPEHTVGTPFRDFLSPESCTVPRRLPFSFEYNIRLPFHMLEKMDIDIFVNPQYDVWVFNTLYAKFRGTASARLSGLGGRAIRGPEVSAVHPMWCLANHSCDPNVTWDWGGHVKFWTRKERVSWNGRDGKVIKSKAGIKKDEEVLNHYCDIDLPVKERREWAHGALGGDCMCERCVWESTEEVASGQKD